MIVAPGGQPRPCTTNTVLPSPNGWFTAIDSGALGRSEAPESGGSGSAPTPRPASGCPAVLVNGPDPDVPCRLALVHRPTRPPAIINAATTPAAATTETIRLRCCPSAAVRGATLVASPRRRPRNRRLGQRRLGPRSIGPRSIGPCGPGPENGGPEKDGPEDPGPDDEASGGQLLSSVPGRDPRVESSLVGLGPASARVLCRYSSINASAVAGSDEPNACPPSTWRYGATSATSAAGVGRAAGSRSRHLASRSASSGGTSLRSGGSVASRTRTSITVSPWYGARPVAANSRVAPSENTSLATTARRVSRACSGAM